MKGRSENLLYVDGLTKAFGGLRAVDNVSFSIRKEEILGLMGPNGSGKTTIFNLISGLLPLDSGKISLDGDDITSLPAHEIAKKGIARTFQGTRIFRNLSLTENFSIARHCRYNEPFLSFSFRGSIIRPGLFNRADFEDKVMTETLEFLELSHLRKKLAGDLSVIEQILIGIGMAMCAEPILLLLDEPFAGLNVGEMDRVISIIQEVRKRGTSVFLIEHHMKGLMGISDRIVVLDYGTKIAEGSPVEISENKEVIKAYLGSRDVTRR